MSLDDMKEILNDCTIDSDILPFLRKKLVDINDKLTRYSEMKMKIEAFINIDVSNAVFESSGITIKEVPDIWIACSRFKGTYREINDHMDSLFSKHGSSVTGFPFSLFYDDDSLAFDADIEVCIPISQEDAGNQTNTRILRGARVLSIIHKGGYDSLYNAYKALVDYLKNNTLTTVYPLREIYIKGQGQLFDCTPENYITEIQFPLSELR